MIWLESKIQCCGCGACEQICPIKCIKMRSDKEGFLYPSLEQELCIHCEKCQSVCPVSYGKDASKESMLAKVYGVTALNETVLKKSSSGGAFGVFAMWFIQQGGVVFGSAFENMVLQHSYAENMEALQKYHGSKYLQSNIMHTYQECKIFLEKGKKVLYSGTPCQIAGLKSYLGVDHNNLLTLEILCHGVPSPEIWERYIKEIESEMGKKIVNAAFRHQDKGWERFRFRILFEDGTEEIMNGEESEFFIAFLKNLTLRPSCYECQYRLPSSKGDIIIGDFWGVSNFHKEAYNSQGVSAIFLLTRKGEKYYQEVSGYFNNTPSFVSHVTPQNGNVMLSVYPSRHREIFFQEAEKKQEPIRTLLTRYSCNFFWNVSGRTFGIWGSYVSRTIIQQLINDSQNRRLFHYSNSSVLSITSKEVPWNQEWGKTIKNKYRLDAVRDDFSKTMIKSLEKGRKADYLVIDLLEERFEIARMEKGVVTLSDGLVENKDFLDLYERRIKKNDITWWKESFDNFLEKIYLVYQPEYIILLELYLNKEWQENGKRFKFKNIDEIEEINELLSRYYFYVKQKAKLHCLELSDKWKYCDKNHRYGCRPEHFNIKAYYELAEKIYDILNGNERYG